MVDSLALLGRVVAAARATMLELDPRDVPPNLVKIAVQTGKKLPPPMARRILEELDMNEWLRDKVAEQFDGEVDSSDRTTAAGALFLTRPAGWQDRLAELESQGTEAAQDTELEHLRGRVTALEKELDAARNKMKRAQREAEMARTEAEKRVTAARMANRSSRDSDQDALKAARRENAGLAQRLGEMARDLDDQRERLRTIRAELLKERRAERPAERAPEPSMWADLDALGAARLLDELTTALAPESEFVEEQLPLVEFEPLELPAGVAPDDRAAVEWLIDCPTPYTLVVDGYNVTFLMNPDSFRKAERRNHLNTELARFRRAAAARPRVIVVYDSDQIGGVSSETGPGGVEVIFTSEGHSADDEVLVLATEMGGSAVVVSTDRRVREGAERVGSLGLWSQALVGWMGV